MSAFTVMTTPEPLSSGIWSNKASTKASRLSSGRLLFSLAPRWTRGGIHSLREMCKDVLHLTLIDAFDSAERAIQFFFGRLRRIISCVTLQEVRESLQQARVVLLRGTVYYL